MKEPGWHSMIPLLGKDPQPKHMNNFVRTFEDNGGVHINSGIPNHAFFQVATLLGGHAWKKRAIYGMMPCATRAREAKHRVPAVCTDYVRGRRALFGLTGLERKAVHEGWAAVGIAV